VGERDAAVALEEDHAQHVDHAAQLQLKQSSFVVLKLEVKILKTLKPLEVCIIGIEPSRNQPSPLTLHTKLNVNETSSCRYVALPM
jgi:hypothetical protein